MSSSSPSSSYLARAVIQLQQRDVLCRYASEPVNLES
ncbi:hypothetical protein EVA_21398 [gut metagenome]|uniref:Uncharacterized protein n=1 Tax=gut metagenome TaxID=749906 RepID=J9BSD9_9ZZZZ